MADQDATDVRNNQLWATCAIYHREALKYFQILRDKGYLP